MRHGKFFSSGRLIKGFVLSVWEERKVTLYGEHSNVHHRMTLGTILRPPVCLLCRLVASVADEGLGNTHTAIPDHGMMTDYTLRGEAHSIVHMFILLPTHKNVNTVPHTLQSKFYHMNYE